MERDQVSIQFILLLTQEKINSQISWSKFSTSNLLPFLFLHCKTTAYILYNHYKEFICLILSLLDWVNISDNVERNRVTKLLCMRKANCKNLRKLGIAGNFITDCESLIDFQSKNIRMIAIEAYESAEQSTDIRWLHKLPA